MDIKDLLGSETNHQSKCEPQSPAYKAPSPLNHPRPIHPTPSFPLTTGTAHPVLPSPTINSSADQYYRRQSTPYHIKPESHEAPQHGWPRYDLHPPTYPFPPHPSYAHYDPNHPALYQGYSPQKRPSIPDEHVPKRQKKGESANRKWDADEDARIIELRGNGMKWGEICKKLPGRTEIACRLHYQNYLEKRGQWDDEKKTKLARVYERMKADLWQPLANELGVPWRSAEAMHWILGDREMARRANAIPFALVSGANSAGPQGEGNGRIAQANRMADTTMYFGPEHLEALRTPGGHTVEQEREPVNVQTVGEFVGGARDRERRYSLAAACTAGETRVNRAYEHNEQVSPTATVTSDRTLATGRASEGVKRQHSHEAEGFRLPPLKALDTQLSGHAPNPTTPSILQHYPAQNSPPPHASQTRHSGSHRSDNSSGSDGEGSASGSERLLALADLSSQTLRAEEKNAARRLSAKSHNDIIQGGRKSSASHCSQQSQISGDGDGSEDEYVRVGRKEAAGDQ